jgi:hypothetical protein
MGGLVTVKLVICELKFKLNSIRFRQFVPLSIVSRLDSIC